jgi:tRNA A-37 threonylcarbamoyl transferase component Bud32
MGARAEREREPLPRAPLEMLPVLRGFLQVPEGFREVRQGKKMALVRGSLDSAWDTLILDAEWHRRDAGARISGGRGEVCLFTFHGQRVVVREYIHGGIREMLLRRHFLTWPPRPISELVLTEECRRRGIQTIEVLGAHVSWTLGPLYGGAILTRYVPESKDLWTWLRENQSESEGREALLVSVGRFLKIVHNAGLYHGDLNLRNLLVRSRPGENVDIFLVDLDRSSLGEGALSGRLARRNLRRFSRSARKLDPDGTTVSARDLDLIFRSYRKQTDDTVRHQSSGSLMRVNN